MSKVKKESKPQISIVFIGNINSGKSSVVQHLLLSKQEAINKSMMESLHGNTMKMQQFKFETAKYDCTLIDVPGGSEFVWKLVLEMPPRTNCAVLVIDSMVDAFEAGMSDNGQTCMHALIAFHLGVEQIICCCNKLDASTREFSRSRFVEIVTKVSSYLVHKVGFKPEKIKFIPTCSLDGQNVTEKSTKVKWYKGPTLLEALDMYTCTSLCLVGQHVFPSIDNIVGKDPTLQSILRSEADTQLSSGRASSLIADHSEVSRIGSHLYTPILDISQGSMNVMFNNTAISTPDVSRFQDLKSSNFGDWNLYEEGHENEDPDQYLSTLADDPPVVQSDISNRSKRLSNRQRSFHNCARDFTNSPPLQRMHLGNMRTCIHCQAKLYPHE
ncbi:hypothetical protein IFM89_018816 [Coptis chinensis]|uniref:Tr-type G domain-containing protein n=1 Tax=Coptis chinensis TaxID=261450 RepID=A0A835GX12_9MAGN|nr:hypothetical protein IFM89_018816 [Coptis chinensis]